MFSFFVVRVIAMFGAYQEVLKMIQLSYIQEQKSPELIKEQP